MITEPYETATLTAMPDSDYTKEHMLLLHKLNEAKRPGQIRRLLKKLERLKIKYPDSERIEVR